MYVNSSANETSLCFAVVVESEQAMKSLKPYKKFLKLTTDYRPFFVWTWHAMDAYTDSLKFSYQTQRLPRTLFPTGLFQRSIFCNLHILLFAPLTSFWTVSKVFLILHFKCTIQLSLRKIFFLPFADWAFPEKVNPPVRISIFLVTDPPSWNSAYLF